MHWAFAPCVTVPQDERWGGPTRASASRRSWWPCWGRPPCVACRAPTPPARPVIASVKHYVGDGGTQGGVDRGDVRVDEATLRAVHMAGYGPSIQAGGATIMASYNSVHGRRCTATSACSRRAGRRAGLQGFVVSDWKAIEELPGSFSDQIVASVNAGVDMLMQPDNYARPTRSCGSWPRTASCRRPASTRRSAAS